jgi:hypothetical protein
MQQPGATDDSAPPCQTSTVGSAPDAPACVWHEVSGSTLSCTSGRITHARTDPGPSGASTRTATKAGTAPCRAEALLLAITGLPWAPSRRSATGSPGWSLLSAHRGTPGLCTDRRVRTSRRVRTRDDRSRGGALARRRRSTRSRRREAVAQSRGTGIRLCRGPTGRYAIEANETRKVPDAAQRASWRVSSRSARTVFGDLANGSGLCDGLSPTRSCEARRRTGKSDRRYCRALEGRCRDQSRRRSSWALPTCPKQRARHFGMALLVPREAASPLGCRRFGDLVCTAEAVYTQGSATNRRWAHETQSRNPSSEDWRHNHWREHHRRIGRRPPLVGTIRHGSARDCGVPRWGTCHWSACYRRRGHSQASCGRDRDRFAESPRARGRRPALAWEPAAVNGVADWRRGGGRSLLAHCASGLRAPPRPQLVHGCLCGGASSVTCWRAACGAWSAGLLALVVARTRCQVVAWRAKPALSRRVRVHPIWTMLVSG